MTGPLHIAWMGAGPPGRESGGVPGVATELLRGLSGRGHRIDCFMPGTGYELPRWAVEQPHLQFVWGTHEWRWDRWYARTRIGSSISGMFSRALGSLRLRREVMRRHRADSYDVIFQFSNIEAFAVPSRLARRVPLVIQPETHIAGELRFMLREWRLALRCTPLYTFAATVAVMGVRVLVQRTMIRRARLVICISSVFRDHMVRDYGLRPERTKVIPNPIKVDRFGDADLARTRAQPPRVLVLGRVSARKGVEDVVAVCRLLLERGSSAHVKIVGGPSLWSDYSKLLDDLPSENAEYVGRIPPTEVPAELAASDVLFQASKYEPFGLTVAEALVSGVPVVATSEVGAIEGVERSVAAVAAPGDVAAMASAIEQLLARLREDPHGVRAKAHEEARRLFAADVVCDALEDTLEALRDGRPLA
jgi:glycosyltransferase involved in cell wall biosynthesis